MSLKGKLRKAKWIAKGLVSRNSRNYLLIGICSLERFEVAHGLISVSGWAYSSVPNLENPALEILNEGQVIFSKPLESRRSEFAISYMETPLASQSGFAAVLKYQSDHDLSARLHFVTKKGDYFFELGRVKKNVCHSIDAYVMDPWAEGQIGDVTAGSLQRKDTCEAPNPENNLKNAIEF